MWRADCHGVLSNMYHKPTDGVLASAAVLLWKHFGYLEISKGIRETLKAEGKNHKGPFLGIGSSSFLTLQVVQVHPWPERVFLDPLLPKLMCGHLPHDTADRSYRTACLSQH